MPIILLAGFAESPQSNGAPALKFGQRWPIKPDEVLQRLNEILGAFAADPRTGERALRQLLAEHPKQFFSASLAVLKSGFDSAGSEFLAALLDERDLLVTPLCNASFCSCDEAIAIAKLVVRRQPQFDVKLARKLPELPAAAAEQAVAILEAVSDGSRIVSVLMPLMRQAGPRLRSKLALLIGRSTKRCDWVAGYLADSDPRTRANAVEALWGVDLPEAGRVFRKAASDPHGRVAVNALVGLYRLGDAGAIASLCEMSRRPDSKNRACAAWGMGETGDPRFLAVLALMNREPEDQVGRHVARAIERLELASARFKERGVLHLRVTDAQALPDGERRLLAAVAASDRWDPILLSPTCFAISENSRIAASHRVLGGDSVTPLLVSFVLCGDCDLAQDELESARAAVLCCLEHKQASDFWAVAHDPDHVLPFTADKAVLMKALNGPSTQAACNPGTTDVFAGLAARAAKPCGSTYVSKLRGNRHLILLAAPGGLPAGAFPSQQPPLEQVLKPLIEGKTAVHTIGLRCASPPESVAILCQRTGGVFVPAGAREQLAELYQQLYSSIRNRYEVLYRTDGAPAGGESKVRVEVYSEFGYGQADVRLY